MKSTRLIIILLVALAVTFFAVSSALAGGWHLMVPNADHDPDAGKWAKESLGDHNKVPHEGLSSSSNQCRTCHAVHDADNTGILDLGDAKVAGVAGTGNSFKLLRNEGRLSECYFCHGATGALSNPDKKPYAEMTEDPDGIGPLPEVVVAPKGEHTLGATSIPDTNVDDTFLGLTTGLTCGNCHTVHGSWSLNGVDEAGELEHAILRRDPAQNGNGTGGQGAAGGVITVESPDAGVNDPVEGTVTQHTGVDIAKNEPEILAAFCGDCHNKNVNWDRGGKGAEGDVEGGSATGGGIASEGERPNSYAHPLGNLDGLIDIYGKLGAVVSEHHIEHHVEEPGGMSCADCHESRGDGVSKFPHQSKGHKLLGDEVVAESTVTGFNYTGDPSRVVPNLDEDVCRECHGAMVDVGEGIDFAGIGDPDRSDSF